LARLVDWLLVLVVLALGTAVVATAALLLGEREFSRRIYPHISVRGVDVGGLPPSDAREQLARRYALFLDNPVEIALGERRWRPTAAQLGVRPVFDEALADAFALGRGNTRVENLRLAAAIWEQGVDLPLRVEVDQAAIQAFLLQVAAEVEAAPQNADVQLEGAQIIPQPEAWGTQVLVDETLADVTAALQGLSRQTVGLRTRQLEPRVRDADVAPVVAELHTLLDQPIVLEGNTGACANVPCRWELSPERIAQWVSLRRGADATGKPTVSVAVDQGGIRNALISVAAAVREEGTLPRVAWNGGRLAITRPGETGIGLDADLAQAQIAEALYKAERAVALPMVPIPPPVTEANLASLGIVGRVGSGISSFANSAEYRITNIRAGARRMNGVLIPPGATFSFNDHLGVVDAAGGFVEGYAIVDNRTQKEWGGGLCQVSTTVFRAAFFGGLPIKERHEHAFRISWYEELGEPVGLDAAIFTPYNDMRFVNDTSAWMLLESYVDLQNQRLSVALYGTPTGREVSYEHRVIERTPAPTRPVYVDDPTLPRGTVRQSDTARGGIKVEIIRTVRENGAVIATNTFPTEFKPWPDIFVRGSGR